MTHKERVELYVKIIKTKLKLPLTEFKVNYMRNAAPTPREPRSAQRSSCTAGLAALNNASTLQQVCYTTD